MGETLQKRIQQQHFESPQQEAVLNLLIAAHHVRQKFEAVCAEYGITLGQYNVLRILNGAYPQGYPRYEIAGRLIEPAPDVTRLIDRLVKAGFAERLAHERDRRLSITRITESGRKLLAKMAPAVAELDNNFLARILSPEEVLELSRICEKIYGTDR